MIIDIHGHYTTAPPQLRAWRNKQIADFKPGVPFTLKPGLPFTLVKKCLGQKEFWDQKRFWVKKYFGSNFW